MIEIELQLEHYTVTVWMKLYETFLDRSIIISFILYRLISIVLYNIEIGLLLSLEVNEEIIHGH